MPAPHEMSSDAKKSLMSADELVRFRDLAQRAARLAADAARELFVGITERSAAEALESRFQGAGSTGWMVPPRVLFGARTTLAGGERGADERPGWSTLDPSETFLLEGVALMAGVPAPFALAGATVGQAPGLGAGQALLADLHQVLPEWIAKGLSARELARRVREFGRRVGWRDLSAPRPGWVLARRVVRLPRAFAPSAAPYGAAGLDRTHVGGYWLRRGLPAGRRRISVWSDHPAADGPVPHGLWLVAPRFARNEVGVASRAWLWHDADGPRWLDEGPLPRV